MIDIISDLGDELGSLEELIQDFLPFAQERFGFKHPPKLFLKSDPENGEDPLGKTAGYSPDKLEIMVFVDKRHPKDILRSLSHELVHHTQNLRGDFDHEFTTDPGYAQSDPFMRDMEREAYEQGNLCFRDWEDSRKMMLNESIYYGIINIDEGENNMSKKETLEDWKNNQIYQSLMEKFGLAKEAKEKKNDDENVDPAANSSAPNFHETDNVDEKTNEDEDEEDEEEDSLGEEIVKLMKEQDELLNEKNIFKRVGDWIYDATTSRDEAVGGTVPSHIQPFAKPEMDWTGGLTPGRGAGMTTKHEYDEETDTAYDFAKASAAIAALGGLALAAPAAGGVAAAETAAPAAAAAETTAASVPTAAGTGAGTTAAGTGAGTTGTSAMSAAEAASAQAAWLERIGVTAAKSPGLWSKVVPWVQKLPSAIGRGANPMNWGRGIQGAFKSAGLGGKSIMAALPAIAAHEAAPILDWEGLTPSGGEEGLGGDWQFPVGLRDWEDIKKQSAFAGLLSQANPWLSKVPGMPYFEHPEGKGTYEYGAPGPRGHRQKAEDVGGTILRKGYRLIGGEPSTDYYMEKAVMPKTVAEKELAQSAQQNLKKSNNECYKQLVDLQKTGQFIDSLSSKCRDALAGEMNALDDERPHVKEADPSGRVRLKMLGSDDSPEAARAGYERERAQNIGVAYDEDEPMSHFIREDSNVDPIEEDMFYEDSPYGWVNESKISNDEWYVSSLYKELKNKWAK